ncbi:MAG: cytochrome c peroxidase [Saprospiraceae bacterium]
MKKYILLSIALILATISCQPEETITKTLDEELKVAIQEKSKTGKLDYYVFPESDDYANLPFQDPANPATKEKVELGNMLFFETGLAQKNKYESCAESYSCGSCHIAAKGYLPGRIQGIADGAHGFGADGEYRALAPGYLETEIDAQGTRPMNILNSGYSTVITWSGIFGAQGVNQNTQEHWVGLADVNYTGFMGLEAQNIEAFGLHRLDINEKVLDEYGYRALYDDAFPDFIEAERYTPTTSSFAISAFLRSLLANRAPFQKYLKGNDNALSENQKKGALLFFGKAGCANCHKSTALSAMEFHALGVPDMYQAYGDLALNTGPEDARNFGRAFFTKKDEDMYRFKVPQLYNIKDYATFFHGSSHTTIEDVVDYKLNAQSENPRVSNDILSSAFEPRTLTVEEKTNLIDFLRNGLYDSDIARYTPASTLSGNCVPNNDPVSQDDLGCN